MEIAALSTVGNSCVDNLFDLITGFCDQPKIDLLQEMPGGIPAMRWDRGCLLPDLYFLHTAMCRRLPELPSIISNPMIAETAYSGTVSTTRGSRSLH